MTQNTKDAGASLSDEQGWLHIDEVKQLCRDFSSRNGNVYIKDVESALDGLATQPKASSADILWEAHLLEVVEHTIDTLARQLDLIAERAPGNFLDKTPVVRSLTAHKQRLERAVDERNMSFVAPTAEQARKDAKTAELHKMLANIMHDQTTAMQSALIEWKHGKGAEAGLQWIVNTLMGPGLLPDFDAEHGTNAQFWFDANQSQPMPKCFCGNPSHIGWMGQGFCGNAHYNEAKAKHDAAPASSTGDQA